MRWLDKNSKGKNPSLKGRNLPSLDIRGIKLPSGWTAKDLTNNGKLPNASIIYGVGAGWLLAFSLYSFFTGMWLTGFLILIPAAALIGFALHFIRHPF